jgi:hypothetical protein
MDVNSHVLRKQGLPKRRGLLSNDADYKTELISINENLNLIVEYRGKPGK